MQLPYAGLLPSQDPLDVFVHFEDPHDHVGGEGVLLQNEFESFLAFQFTVVDEAPELAAEGCDCFLMSILSVKITSKLTWGFGVLGFYLGINL